MLANELVACVVLIAARLGIPQSLLGVTLLAWGSSVGDFVNNLNLSRRGLVSMAVAAAFASERCWAGDAGPRVGGTSGLTSTCTPTASTGRIMNMQISHPAVVPCHSQPHPQHSPKHKCARRQTHAPS